MSETNKLNCRGKLKRTRRNSKGMKWKRIEWRSNVAVEGHKSATWPAQKRNEKAKQTN